MVKKFINRSIIFRISVVAIAVVSVVVRLWHIDAPIADWHSWRQSDTAAVARNFMRFGFDPLRPRYNDVSSIPSGLDNPYGWRMVEVPIYQSIATILYEAYQGFSIEVWLRLVTIASSAGSGVLLALIFASLGEPMVGIVAQGTYGILPYSVYYGRTTLPEPTGVFFALLSVYVMLKALMKINRIQWYLLVLSSVASAIALLIKPFTIFLLLPCGYLLYRKYSVSKALILRLFLYSVIALSPLYLWRQWILQYPEGIPAFTWLLNGNGIRFKGAWFHWLFAERVGNLILGYWGLIPFGLGLVLKPTKNEGWVSRLWLLGALLYFIIVATGNVQHDYYQILIIPVVAVYVAKGFVSFFTTPSFSKFFTFPFALFTLLCMLAFSWFTLRTFYWINRPEIVEAGHAADTLLPIGAKVIAPYNGDTTFLYQTGRQGWPIGFDIDKKIKMGATHYVTVSPKDNDLETKDLAGRYTVLVRNDKFAIIDLTKPRVP